MDKKNPLDGKHNIFLTGFAGTGKTYLINRYIEEHEGRVLLCAPTGTAAANIGGVTMHKLFGIPVPAYGAKPKTTKEILTNFACADTLIIDEISMASAPMFSYAMQVLKLAKRATGKKIRLIVVGDFSQLPPVVTKTEEKYYKKYGFDKSGFCFTTKEWADCKFKTASVGSKKTVKKVK